jgi:hypothetical protein
MKMNKDLIETAANEIQKLRSEGWTPYVTVEYGSSILTDLIDYFKNSLGIHAPLLDLIDKSEEDKKKGLETIRQAMEFMDKEVVAFIAFRSNMQDAMEAAEALDGHCVVVRKAWRHEGIEVEKL